MITVPVKASKEYEIHIGAGLMHRAGEYLRTVAKGHRVMLVCGDIVEGLYADLVTESLECEGFLVSRFVYPHGEQSKTPASYLALLEALAAADMTRSDTIVALGGGVTGDLAGFAAATYQRGIAYVQMPTTLLAAVDSSVGGKTAIDLPAGKNLVGAFYQPELVLCDTDALKTLPDEVFADGFGEIIKYGVIWDEKLLERLERDSANHIDEIIGRCVAIKAEIVAQDEFDKGLRGLLNFGHTVGHAIEKCSGFSVSHGSAVAIGMVIVSVAAAMAGLCSCSVPNRVRFLVKGCGLPDTTEYDSETLLQAMRGDKKRVGRKINLIVPRAIGKAEIRTMTLEEMDRFLRPAMEGTR